MNSKHNSTTAKKAQNENNLAFVVRCHAAETDRTDQERVCEYVSGGHFGQLDLT